jgi:hypothetical protein
MKWKLIWKSLAAAAAGGALTGATAALQNGQASLEGLGVASAIGALTTVLAYLKQSPLPPSSDDAR